jgi:hypothetical protein
MLCNRGWSPGTLRPRAVLHKVLHSAAAMPAVSHSRCVYSRWSGLLVRSPFFLRFFDCILTVQMFQQIYGASAAVPAESHDAEGAVGQDEILSS